MGIVHLPDVLASNWNFENKVCVTLIILKKYGRDCHCLVEEEYDTGNIKR